MPIKVCPKCLTKHGCRRLVCECGHDFQCKRKDKQTVTASAVTHDFPYPEPGTWVWSLPRGMPPIKPPEELPDGLLSAGQVKAQVSYEGLGFCVYSFIRADRIADEKLRELWVKTRAAMGEIVEYLDQIVWEKECQ